MDQCNILLFLHDISPRGIGLYVVCYKADKRWMDKNAGGIWKGPELDESYAACVNVTCLCSLVSMHVWLVKFNPYITCHMSTRMLNNNEVLVSSYRCSDT